MSKNKVYILIYLSIILPVLLSAGALDRYTIPQQHPERTVQPKSTVNESVYIDFRNQTRNYSRAKREEMKEYYRKKLKEAVRERNFDAASHYERLIGILNTN